MWPWLIAMIGMVKTRDLGSVVGNQFDVKK